MCIQERRERKKGNVDYSFEKFSCQGNGKWEGNWRAMLGSREESIKKEENVACLHTDGGQINNL